MGGVLNLSSLTTFLYFDDLEAARKFFDEVLELEVVYDPKWACVWRIGKDSFVGAVDIEKGAIHSRYDGGVLLSITVTNIEDAYERLKQKGIKEMSGIVMKEDLGLKSFLFTGPEGHKFEVQQFVTEELSKLF